MHATGFLVDARERDAGVHRASVWAALALAVAADASTPGAGLFLARCLAGSWTDAALRALSLDHVMAFPCTTAAMLLACVPSRAHDARQWLHLAATRVLLMGVSMVPACAIASLAASALSIRLAPWGFAGAMVLACGVLVRALGSAAAGCTRVRGVGPAGA